MSEMEFKCKECGTESPIECFPFRAEKHKNKSLWNYCNKVGSSGVSCIQKAKIDRGKALTKGSFLF